MPDARRVRGTGILTRAVAPMSRAQNLQAMSLEQLKIRCRAAADILGAKSEGVGFYQNRLRSVASLATPDELTRIRERLANPYCASASANSALDADEAESAARERPPAPRQPPPDARPEL